MLKVIPTPFITTKVIAMVHGTTSAATAALARLAVKRNTTTTASTSPSRIASRTLAIDSRTSGA